MVGSDILLHYIETQVIRIEIQAKGREQIFLRTIGFYNNIKYDTMIIVITMQ